MKASVITIEVNEAEVRKAMGPGFDLLSYLQNEFDNAGIPAFIREHSGWLSVRTAPSRAELEQKGERR